MWFRKTTVPENNETKQIDVVQTWEVRWRSRHGEYSGDTREQVEVFTDEQAAKDFETALDNANKLLRNTSNTHVSVKKRV